MDMDTYLDDLILKSTHARDKMQRWFNEDQPRVDLTRPEAFDEAWDKVKNDPMPLMSARAREVQAHDADPMNLS